ncbi:MAG: hypothetical protein ACK4GE_04310 [Caldimicrobium sp.]
MLKGQYVGLAILQDGSAYLYGGNGFLLLANPGTFSGDPAKIDIAVWQNERFYIVDKEKGYFKLWKNPNSNFWEIVQVIPELKGDCILVWQGRVFIANDNIVQYSVALNPEDFTGQGSGYFDLAQSFPVLKLKVKKLVPYVGDLIIVGDNAILSLSGTTVSNDPSNWYLVQITDTVGIENNCIAIVYNNVLYMQNEKGIYRGIPTSLEKIDYKVQIANLKFLNRQTSLCQIENLLFYPIPVQAYSHIRKQVCDVFLFFCEALGEFYYVDLSFNVYGIYWSIVPGVENQIYVLGEDGLYKWGLGDEAIECMFKSKAFNLGDNIREKLWRNVIFSVLVYPPYHTLFILQGETEINQYEEVVRVEEPPIESLYYPFGFQYENLPPFVVIWQGIHFFLNIQNVPLEEGKIKKVHTIIHSTFDAVGRYFSFVFREKGRSEIEITHFGITGQIGRRFI